MRELERLSIGLSSISNADAVMRARSMAVLVCAVGCLTVYALVNFLPAFPKSIAEWLALLFLGVPVLIGTEVLGDRVLGSRTLARRSSVARGTIALIAFILFLIVLIPPRWVSRPR